MRSSPGAGGSSGGAQQDPVLDSQSAGHDAETVLFFVDLEDSTPLWESDPEAMKHAIARFEQLIDEAVDGAGGKAFKATGDGKLATMPTVLRAADAAETFVRSMASEDWGTLGELRARVAIDVGETEARAGDHFGPTMNRAGRLMSLGHGGQVLLSAAANSALSDQRKTIDLGEHRLKGVGRPQRIFQLVVDGVSNEFPPLRGHSGGGPTTRSGFGPAIRGFELREEIGAGDFGVVYRAFQTSVGREVAIKVIRPEYANQPVFVKRFEAEAQFVAQLEHPHIVSLYGSQARSKPLLPKRVTPSRIQAPTGQCSTETSLIGKSSGFPVARVASIPTAAAAIRQSA